MTPLKKGTSKVKAWKAPAINYNIFNNCTESPHNNFFGVKCRKIHRIDLVETSFLSKVSDFSPSPGIEMEKRKDLIGYTSIILSFTDYEVALNNRTLFRPYLQYIRQYSRGFITCLLK